MKQDAAVSEVIGTILLITMVTLFAGVVTIICIAEAGDLAEEVPIVSFKESADPHYLYHAGGDSLLKSEVRVYYRDRDITDLTTINGKAWDIWKTGDALYLTWQIETSQITIVGKTSKGRVIILYEGIKKS